MLHPLLFIALTIFALGTAHAQEFSFRKAELNMPLSEFRKLQHPDAQGDKVRSKTVLMCSNDRLPEPRSTFSEIEQKTATDNYIKRITCAYFDYSQDAKNNHQSWKISPIQIGTIKANPVVYHFIPDAEGVYRLYLIIARHSFNNWDYILSLLTVRWGAPDKLWFGGVKPEAAVLRRNTYAQWEKGDGRMLMMGDADVARINSLSFLSKSLARLYAEAGQRLTAEEASKL